MNYNLFILDLDGTVYIDGRPILNVITQLNKLTDEGKSILFLTNNTSVAKKKYIVKLQKMGLHFVTERNIITPVDVFLNYSKGNFDSCYYLLPAEVISEIEGLNGPKHVTKNPDIILSGFDKELTYNKLKKACEFINEGINYYITHIDLSCPSEKGPIPDSGSIASLLMDTTGEKWIKDFGKPSNLMNDYLKEIIKDLGVEINNVVLIGDRYYTDIKLGNEVGVDTVHVQTGEQQIEEEVINIPTFEFDNISNFIEWQYLNKQEISQ